MAGGIQGGGQGRHAISSLQEHRQHLDELTPRAEPQRSEMCITARQVVCLGWLGKVNGDEDVFSLALLKPDPALFCGV